MKMKIRLNPIVKKDLKVTVRSMRISWVLLAYEAALTVAFLLALLSFQEEVSYMTGGNIYSVLIYLFIVVAAVQVCIVALYVPVITASSISGEKERQTFDIMLTTCMTPFSIVLGKVLSAVLRTLFYVAASTPIMALSFVVGGLHWLNLFYYLLAIILFSVFAGSIGIFASSFCRRSVSAVLLSFGMYFVFFFMTFLPCIFSEIRVGFEGNIGESMLPLLMNPIIFFEEFFMQMMTGSSFFEGYVGDVGPVTDMLTGDKVWMFTSAGCILLLSLLFMVLAAWEIDPMRGGFRDRPGRKRRNKKNRTGQENETTESE